MLLRAHSHSYGLRLRNTTSFYLILPTVPGLRYNTSMQTFKIEKTETQCVVTWRNFPLLFVLITFLAFPVFFGVFLLPEQRFADFAVMCGVSLLFSTPFFVIFLCLWFWKGRLVLDETGLESLSTFFAIESKKRVRLDELRLFKKEISRGSKGSTSSKLRAVCQGSNVDFITLGASQKEINDLCEQLNALLNRLKTAGVPAKWEESFTFGFDTPPQHLELPTKSRWHYQTDFDGIGFQKRGEEDAMGDVVGAFFFAMVAGGFALLIRGESIILIPIVLIGLYFCILGLHYILELFRVTTWTFADGEVRFRTARLGLARRTTHDLTGWNSLVVRVSETEIDHAKELELDCDAEKIRDYYAGESVWQLAFLDAAGERIIAIENLSKSESLWMADVLLREQRAVR